MWTPDKANGKYSAKNKTAEANRMQAGRQPGPPLPPASAHYSHYNEVSQSSTGFLSSGSNGPRFLHHGNPLPLAPPPNRSNNWISGGNGGNPSRLLHSAGPLPPTNPGPGGGNIMMNFYAGSQTSLNSAPACPPYQHLNEYVEFRVSYKQN